MLAKEPFHPIRVRDLIFTIQDKSTVIRIFDSDGKKSIMTILISMSQIGIFLISDSVKKMVIRVS